MIAIGLIASILGNSISAIAIIVCLIITAFGVLIAWLHGMKAITDQHRIQQRNDIGALMALGVELQQKIISDPGIAGPPGSARFPSPGIQAEVGEWIESSKKTVGQAHQWFIGYLLSDANLIYDSPPTPTPKSSEHHDLIRNVQNRLTRLGELVKLI